MTFTSVSLDLSALQAGQSAAAMTDRVAERDFVAARDGNRDAFVRLVRQHQGRVYSVALRLTGRREDAQELAQDAFLALHARLQTLESARHVRHWVCRTVTHRSIDLLRSRGRRLQPLATEELLLTVAADEDSSDPLLHRTLRVLLLKLPEIPRAVMVLRFQEDLDPLDIAEMLDLPLNTVKSHLRRSLDWLRSQGLEMDI